MSQIKGKTALVTGANRGIGKAFVQELLEAGITKIYASARQLNSLGDLVANGNGRIIPVQLDVTKPEMIEKATTAHKDVDIVINNAGISTFKGLIGANGDTFSRLEMEVNYFGTLNMIRAFAPVLKSNGGGVIVNMSSILGHINFPILGSYCAAKAAVHSLTQGVRAELAAQGTQVVGVYPGPVDTDMGAHFPMEKADPNTIAKTVIEGIEAGEQDIYPDPTSQQLRTGLLNDPKAVEARASQMLPA